MSRCLDLYNEAVNTLEADNKLCQYKYNGFQGVVELHGILYHIDITKLSHEEYNKLKAKWRSNDGYETI